MSGLHKPGMRMILVLFLLLFAGYSAMADILPQVTVRFANPRYNCTTQSYCLDVEFQSDTPDQQLYGMNVRFFYDNLVLAYQSMGDFADGYSAVSPTPPEISVSGPTAGALLFNFPANHPFSFLNGAIQLTGSSSLMISTTGWTKIFSVCFNVIDPTAINTGSFCPSIVWDLQHNPANGGFLTGDDGIVITVVAPPPIYSTQTSEADVHFNWLFGADPDNRPYGAPSNIVCVSTQGILATTTTTNPSCNGGSNGTATAVPSNGTAPYSFTWSNGATTATASGLAAGDYFVTVTDGNQCSTTTQATITQPAVLLAGTAGISQTICTNNAPVSLSATAPSGESGSYVYQWESSSNGTSWDPITGATNLSYSPGVLTSTTYYRVKQSGAGCTNFVHTNTVIITVIQPVLATVNPDQYLCNQFTTVLAGTWPPVGSSGNWEFVSGPSTVTLGPANSPVVAVTGLIGSSVPYIFRYTLTTTSGGVSCTSTALATVYNYHYASTAYAGADQQICLSSGSSASTTLNGNNPVYGGGKWTQYSGPTTALFADPFNPATAVSNLISGNYTFFWKIGNGVCDSTSDAVIITVGTPATASVSSDATVCATVENYTVHGTAGNYTGILWTTGGTGTFNNIHDLNPVYTFSHADIVAGSVILTMTAFSSTPCPNASASMTLTIHPAPVANAGQDATICESSSNYVCNATAANYTNFYWETLGTGTFNNIYILNPVYVPSAGDIAAGCVYLVLHVQGTPPCGAVTDTMKLCIIHTPVAYAGPDALICQGSTWSLSQAYAHNAGYITWSTSGDGTFNDIHIEKPVYTIGANDITNGSVTLTMNVTGMSPCPNASDAMVISIHPRPSVTISVVSNTSCHTTADGSLQANATGGTPPYSYLWSNGQTTATATGLASGNYSVTVTDSFGCTNDAQGTITSPNELLVNGVVYDVLCHGGNTGEVVIAATGGTLPYSYLWSNGLTTKNIYNLTIGSYTVTVTDSKNCTVNRTFVVGEPSQLAVTGTPEDTRCNLSCDGSVMTVTEGGTAPYTYAWSNGATTADIEGLCAGSYTVTVTDAHTCDVTATWTIGSPAAVAVTGVVHDALCHGSATGSIDITPAGGVAPYTYVWSTGATTGNVSGLIAGHYTVTVTDSHTCDKVGAWDVNQPDEIAWTGTKTDVTCFGAGNGTVTTTSTTGGTSPYTYLWSNGVTTENLTGLVPGTYTVTITDAHSCHGYGSIGITQPDELLVSATATITIPTCNGYCNGLISGISVSGGTSPFTYLWDNGTTTADVAGLCTGTHSVTVTDFNHCTATQNFFVGEPTHVAVSGTPVETKCNLSCDGEISTIASGGTGPYTYMWSNSATTANISALCAGTYTVTVTDSHSCDVTGTWTVGSPAALTITGTVTDALCNMSNTGTINITPSGGTMPYGYLWSNGATTEDVGGLYAGTYGVTVTDANLCEKSASFVVNEPGEVSWTGDTQNISCNGAHDGSITTLTTDGGTAPYTYHWEGPAGFTGATADLTNLGPGWYYLTVTDAHSCDARAQREITQPDQLLIGGGVVISMPACNGFCNGSITSVIVTGGTQPYSYLWDNGTTNADATGLCAGTHGVTVTDAHNCQTTGSWSVGQPDPLAATGIVTDVLCNGMNTGAIAVTATGGTTPYSYLWSNTQTTATISALVAGTYTVTVTDFNLCTIVKSWTVTEPSAQSVTGVATDVVCHGGNNGAVDIVNSGGVAPYYYAWSNGGTTQNISGLIAGTYSVTITDAHSCDISGSWTVNEPSLLAVSGAVTPVTCYTYSDGAINITATGGVAPYSYLWSNGATDEDLTGLLYGTYGVTVTDSHLCTTTGSWTVNQPPAWSIDITGPQSVCVNSTNNQYCAVVTDPANPGALYSYEWVVTGGIITGGQNTPCILVTWPPCSTGTVTLVVTRLSDGCHLTKTITVTENPVPAPVISGPVTVTAGDNGVQYCTTYLPGHLYSWSVVGGTVVSGQGTSCITVNWGPYPACGCGHITVDETFNGCMGSYTLPITILPGSNTSIAGYVKYGNGQQTPLNGVTVQLRNSSGNVVGNTVTANNTITGTPGYYAFTGLAAGNYELKGSYNGPWGGNNATDALIIQLNVLGTYPLGFLKDTVANVNGSVSPAISALDALYVKLRTVGSITSYPAGDWKVTDTTVAFTGTPLPVDLTALCVGDVNGSFIPMGSKQAPLLSIVQDGVMPVRVGEEFNYEVKGSTHVGLGAMTLFMSFDMDRFEITSVNSNLDELKYTIRDGGIALAWADTKPLQVNPQEPIFSFRIKAKQNMMEPRQIFTLNAGSEFADISATPFENFDLKMASVMTVTGTDEVTLNNYPNPFKHNTTIVYTLPQQGHVKLVLTNLYGEVVRTLTDANEAMGTHSIVVDPVEMHMAAGVYIYRLVFEDATDTYSKVNKMVFTR